MRRFVPVLVLIVGLVAPVGAQDESVEPSADEANVAELEDLMARIRARVDGIDKAAAQRDEALEFLTEQVDRAMRSLSSQRDQNTSLQQKNADLNWEVESLVESRAELNAQLSSVTTERDTLVSELQIQVAELAELLSLEQQAKAELTEEIAGLSTELRATLDDKEALREQLETMTAALEASEEQVAQQKEQLVELGQRLEIALATKVQKLSRYRSEFFGRLRTALGDHPDIRIVGDRFVFQSEVLFESGSAELLDPGKEQMLRLAGTLKDISGDIPKDIDWILRVDGHTAQRAISTTHYPSNWELSSARAISVVRFLIDQGLPPKRLAATGFGEFQPIDPGDDEIAYRRNRRIEFKLTQR